MIVLGEVQNIWVKQMYSNSLRHIHSVMALSPPVFLFNSIISIPSHGGVLPTPACSGGFALLSTLDPRLHADSFYSLPGAALEMAPPSIYSPSAIQRYSVLVSMVCFSVADKTCIHTSYKYTI